MDSMRRIIIRIIASRAVNKLSEFLTNPSQLHLDDRVLRCLDGTKSLAIQYSLNSDTFLCAAFVDNIDRKSTEGFLFKLFGGSIDWKLVNKRRSQYRPQR